MAAALELAADDIGASVRSLQILDDILDRIPLPMTVGNNDGWVACSKAFSDLLGWSRAQLEVTPWKQIIHEGDHDSTWAECLRVVNENVIGVTENRYLSTDGNYHRLRWRWGPPGKSGYTVAVAEDLGVADDA